MNLSDAIINAVKNPVPSTTEALVDAIGALVCTEEGPVQGHWEADALRSLGDAVVTAWNDSEQARREALRESFE